MPHVFAMLGRGVTVSIATALAGALVILATAALFAAIGGSDPLDALGLVMFWLPPILIVAALATGLGVLFVGLPVMLVLRALEKESCSSYVWAGAIGGALFALLLNLPGDPVIPNGIMLMGGAGYGAVAGVLFWKVFRKKKVALATE